MGAEITPHAVTTTHDESDGLQNAFVTPTPAGDADDNDIDVALLPSEFSSRLIAFNMDPTTEALGAALSGYTGGADEGDAIFTVTATDGGEITGILFADADGNPIVGVDTEAQTLDGNNIFLYSDPENDNILIGREGNGTTADPNGDIVLAAYIEEEVITEGQVIDGKLWVVQYEPIKHPGVGDPDDDEPFDLFGNVFVASTTTLEFSLQNAPSGQNLFLMFTEENPTTFDDNGTTRISNPTIVATGKAPANESEEGVELQDGDTINSSQAGGPTTFGTNNQMINEGQGIVYSFVTGANQDYTIPNLSQTEADVEAFIDFTDTFEARSAMFDVVQLQSGKTAVVQISAFDTEVESGVNFIDGYADDTSVAILEVVVRDEFGNILEHSDGSVNDPGIEISIVSGVATVSGVEADTTIEYTTDGDHNRVLIENAGDGKGKDSADFDIGAIQLTNVTTDSESLQGQFIIEDDGPGVDPGDDPVADPLVVDETDLTQDATADFSDNLTALFTGGTDGQSTIDTSYVLSIGGAGATTNLVDVATGDAVVLVDNGGVLEGQTSAGDVVFTVSVDGSGTVTLDQQRALEHSVTTDHDDPVSLNADHIVLTRTDTITDGDGDTASDSESLDIGVAMTFHDDGPAIDVTIAAAADPLVVDETDLTQDATADFSDNFSNTSDGGADGTASISSAYVLSVGGAGATTNLVDVATGDAVVLVDNGGVLEGQTSAGDVVFTVSVDGSGTVTLDQQRALEHSVTTDHDDPVSLNADHIVLTRTDTITDGDGDTASDSESLDIGVAMTFHDDGPAIDVTIAAAADPLVVDETDLTQDATADFSDNFSNTSDGGADGTASISSAYVLSVGGAGATTNLVDVATGDAVVLVDNGGVLEGQTSAGDVVFTVSVDGSGTVTLDQQRALEHSVTTDHDDPVSLNADHIVLTRTDTITDGDGDTASDSESLDIGVAMTFHDDGPAIDVTIAAAADPLVVDETDLTQDATADFSDNFSNTSDGGADGTASISSAYVLSVGGAGATTNLVDVATGDAVVLVDNGGVLEGQTSAGDVVFTVSVDGSGTVTLDQQRALEHSVTTDHDDPVSLNADHIVLTRTDTITDGDGDTASDSESLDIGVAMTFHDDGPAIDVTIAAAADPLVVDETDLTQDATADFSDNFSNTSDGGADGTASISSAYVLSVGGAGATTNLVDVATGDAVVLVDNGGVLEGQTSAGDVVFTVSVDGSGTVTLDQQRALEHSVTTDHDDPVSLNADHIVLTRTDTITDGDGDTASDSESLDIGVAMTFHDDGPAIDVTIAAAADPLVVDETDLTQDATADFSDNFSNTSDGGADGTASISSAYVLSVGGAGATTNLVDVATGDAVVLVDNGGVLEGQTSAGDVVFTVSVDGSGTVTLDQQRALEHSVTTDHDDPVSLNADHIVLTRTDTITDGDGDTASDSESLDIGVAMTFHDDGPAIDVTIAAAADPLVVDETDLTQDATADFSDNFSNTSDGGADGTASISSAYVLSVGGAGATTNLVDVATGDAVVLVDNGGVLEGQTSAGDVVFTVSVDGSGTVTLDQQRALEHSVTTDHDDPVSLNADHIVLTRTDTITDGDGDTASDSESLDIGVAMTFHDDGPAIDVTIAAAADPLVVDETDLTQDATADFSDNFSNTSDGGADGTASISSAYVLSVGGAGATTNLVDVATGDAVVLVDNGGVLEGQTSAGDVVFTVSVDGSGTVTLDQQRALEHPVTTDHDDPVSLNADHIVLTRTDTITDGDGDTASDSESLDIGVAMTFHDDGPAIITPPVQDTDPDLGETAWVYSGDFEYSVGADQNEAYLTSDDSDFANFSLTGTANEVPIGSPDVSWVSEDDSSATFDVSFTYDHDRDPTTADESVTGTLVFDKVNDTYTFTMDALQVDVDVTLGEGTGYETYDIGGTTPSTGPSPVATGQLGEGFYIQLTGFEEPLSAGGDTVVSSGETVDGDVASVTLSSVALGVNGNTIQGGEAANIGFFASDPMGDINATDSITVTDFFLQFDGFETEVDDLVLVLELVDPDGILSPTTRAIYVDQGDVYESDTDNSDLVGTKYEPIVNNLDNNDALLIIESNDYNINPGDNYEIQTIQILAHDDFLTGDAINLNPGVGEDGGSATGAMIQDDSSTGPIKIQDAGFSSTSTTPPTLDLELDFNVVDADGDSTATQTIHIENLMTEELDALLSGAGLENGETSGTGSEGVAPAESTTEVLAELVVLADEQDLQSGLVG